MADSKRNSFDEIVHKDLKSIVSKYVDFEDFEFNDKTTASIACYCEVFDYKLPKYLGENIFMRACVNSQLKFAKWFKMYYNPFIENPIEFLSYICSYSLLEVLKWFIENYKIKKEDFISHMYIDQISSSGRLDVLKWCIDKFQLSRVEVLENVNYSPFVSACIVGHLHIAKWFTDTYQIDETTVRNNNNFIFRHVCEYGHLEVAKWLVSRFHINREDAKAFYNYAFYSAQDNKHVNITEWLFAEFGINDGI
jgi:hypothetical protein